VFQSSFSNQTNQGHVEDCYDALAVPFNKQPSMEKPVPGSTAGLPGGSPKASQPAKHEGPSAQQARQSTGGDVGGQAFSTAMSIGGGEAEGQSKASHSHGSIDGYDPSRRDSMGSGQAHVIHEFSHRYICCSLQPLW
jgi:hypothetical protein